MEYDVITPSLQNFNPQNIDFARGFNTAFANLETMPTLRVQPSLQNFNAPTVTVREPGETVIIHDNVNSIFT